MSGIQYYTKSNCEKLAYMQHKRNTPSGVKHVVFLGGFKSDMQGSKAMALDGWCAERGVGFTRFDYRGHGQSDGEFLDGCIGDWLEDTLDILDHIVGEPCMVVGSSMGGWLGLLAALRRPEQVRALTLIAPAPDFTEKLIWQQATDEQKQQMDKQGYFDIPNCYADEEPFRITKKLIEDGRRHLILDAAIAISAPIRLLHGMADEDVPWQMSTQIAEQVVSEDVEIHLLKNAGHRMSEPEQLELLIHTLAGLCHPAFIAGSDSRHSAG